MDITNLLGFSIYDPLSEERFEHYKNLMDPIIFEGYCKQTYNRIVDNYYDETQPAWGDLELHLKQKIEMSVIIAGLIRNIVKKAFVVVCSFDDLLVSMDPSERERMQREIRKFGCRLRENSKNIVEKFNQIPDSPWTRQ